jgi:Transposase DDE domain group 1
MSTPTSAISSWAATRPTPVISSSWATCPANGAIACSMVVSRAATCWLCRSMLSSIIGRITAWWSVKNPRSASSSATSLARSRRRASWADSAGATHAFLDHLREQGMRFSVGFDLDSRVRAAILTLPADAWVAAVDADGGDRDGAQVAELAGLDLPAAGWPAGTRAICRRERPHPGAQLTFSDADGWRFQVFVTDQPDPDLARLELRHRQRARVEDRIRAAKATGARNLPFDLWRRNAVWLQLVLLALDLVGWAQALLLDGDLAIAEPKTLRYRLWHTAGRISRHARRLRLRLQRTWPWAAALVRAFTRLNALPLRC